MILFISPHNDDAALFGAYTLIRKHPLVLTVTDSWKQFNRGENITAKQRREEDIEAMKILRCPIVFGGIRDDVIDEWSVRRILESFHNFDEVYAPAVQGGNPDHDLIGRIAKEIFGDMCKQYTTYTKDLPRTNGNYAIEPNDREVNMKSQALECYKSQINLPSTKIYFDSVKGMPEWFI